jgi:hypothetical protein
MEPEGSLPQSQVPGNCPYPEPASFVDRCMDFAEQGVLGVKR